MRKVEWSANVYDRLIYGLAIKGDFEKVKVAMDKQQIEKLWLCLRYV
jgi:hypothetical protein